MKGLLLIIFISILIFHQAQSSLLTQKQLIELVNQYKCLFQPTNSTTNYYTTYSQCLDKHASTHANQMLEQGKFVEYSENYKAICDDIDNQKFTTISFRHSDESLPDYKVLDSFFQQRILEYDYNDKNNTATRLLAAILWNDSQSIACARSGQWMSCAFAPKVGGLVSMTNYQTNYDKQFFGNNNDKTNEICFDSITTVQYTFVRVDERGNVIVEPIDEEKPNDNDDTIIVEPSKPIDQEKPNEIDQIDLDNTKEDPDDTIIKIAIPTITTTNTNNNDNVDISNDNNTQLGEPAYPDGDKTTNTPNTPTNDENDKNDENDENDDNNDDNINNGLPNAAFTYVISEILNVLAVSIIAGVVAFIVV